MYRFDMSPLMSFRSVKRVFLFTAGLVVGYFRTKLGERGTKMPKCKCGKELLFVRAAMGLDKCLGCTIKQQKIWPV
jgi:hypothetical protein